MSNLIHQTPFNLDAEQDILAAIIIDNNNINYIASFLKSEHFYHELNGIIYKEILDIIGNGKIADIVNIAYNLNNNEVFEKENGKNYLNSLINRVAMMIPVKERGLIVYDTFVRRKLIEVSNNIHQYAVFSYGENLNDIVDVAESEIFKIRNNAINKSEPKEIGSHFKNTLTLTQKARKGELIPGMPTGFADLDDLLSGMNPSDLIIIAARPSMGKTALAINIAYNIAMELQAKDSNESVAFFSLEMSSDQISTRVLSMVSGVSSVAIRTGKYSKYDEEYKVSGKAGKSLEDIDFAKLQDVVQSLENIPLYIDDTPSLSTSLLRTRCRMLKRRHNLSVIIVDYLQLMRASDIGSNANRVLEIAEITQTLKAIAKELNIPVIALSQLSRAVELRDDKRPQLADLRESGSIEQDAGVVMFIYRDEYYLEKSKPQNPKDPNDVQAKDTKEYKAWMDKMYGTPAKDVNGNYIVDSYTGEVKLFGGARNVSEILIAKHRNGPVGKVRLYFDKSRTLFGDLVDS